MNENRLKISNPQRISRILRRICQASLPLMVRAAGATGVAVKGRAANIVVDVAQPAMRISNISDKGIAHLGAATKVQVEFVMMSTMVVFVANILSREQNSVLISLPQALVSIERRRNARYNTTEDLCAFLDMSLFRPSDQDVTAAPFYPQYRTLTSHIALADISFGGVCAVTRFPAVSAVLKRGLIDDQARLVLPMQQPLEVGVEVRWFKRIKEHIKGREEDDAYMRSYRFGLEFTSHSDQVRVAIRQFIQALSQADAI
jgi:hypothetical protein